MYKEVIIKDKDWSLNLEDEYYENHPGEVMKECMDAVRQTGIGCYVNLVTPGKNGDPKDGLISLLNEQFIMEEITVVDVRYIDECGRGGHVTRVYR